MFLGGGGGRAIRQSRRRRPVQALDLEALLGEAAGFLDETAQRQISRTILDRRRDQQVTRALQSLLPGNARPQLGPPAPSNLPALEARAAGESSGGQSVDPLALAVERQVIEPAKRANVLQEGPTVGQRVYEALANAGVLLAPTGGAAASRLAPALGRLIGRDAASSLARAATLPIRHPIASSAGAPVAAEAPAAAVNHDPGRLVGALEGTGNFANFLNNAGTAVSESIPGVVGNAVGDVISLPAQVLPSAYLTGAALVEAAQGRPERAQGLWEDFTEQSAIPPLLTGDFGEAASRAGEHPVYTGLEAAGIKAALGRGAGRVARTGALGERAQQVAGREHRPSLRVYGDINIDRGRYSRDMATAALQRMLDRRAAGRNYRATDRQARRHLSSRLDRTMFAGEQARRGAINTAEAAMAGVRELAETPETADALALGVQRIARNPETALNDLRSYRQGLMDERQRMINDPQGSGASVGKLRSNEATIARVDAAIADGRPEALVAAADAFIGLQEPIRKGLVEEGLLDPEQATRAEAIGFLRTQEGARHGLSNEDAARAAEVQAAMKGKEFGSPEFTGLAGQLNRLRAGEQFLTPEGEPYSVEMIAQALSDAGAEAPGYVSNRPGELSRGAAYYRPSDTRGTGHSRRSTGEAVVQGTSDTGFEPLTRQLMGDVSRLQQAKNYDHETRQYGLARPDGSYFPAGTGRLAIQNPEDYGMSLPDIPGGWTVRKVVPWPTRSAELEAAGRERPASAGELDTTNLAGEERFMAEAIRRAYDDSTGGDEVLFPKILADRQRAHFAEKMPIERTAEAATGLWKSAILPTSVGWAAGQVSDIWLVRTPIAGVTIGDIRAGRGLERLAKEELSPEEFTRSFESMVPGGVYGQVQRLQPYRAYEQFVGTHLEPLWKAATQLRNAPGGRQFGDAYRRYRDAIFHFNNNIIERTPQFGALSKIAREEVGLTRRQWKKAIEAQEPVVMDFIRGFRNQDKVDRYAKAIEDIYGNWGKNGPEARRFLNTWSPFWMWLRAATKFAFVTLPRDHPVLTGIIAASEQATREERELWGLERTGEEPLPDFTQGSLPLADGGVRRVNNLTTFGAFADPPSFLAGMVAPQFSSAVFSGLGLDWKGDRLSAPDGSPATAEQKLLSAALSTGEGFVPFFNTTKQIIERGFAGLNPARKFDASTVDYLRSLSESRQIEVPITDSDPGASGVVSADELSELVNPSGSSNSGVVSADEIAKLLSP